MDAVTVTTHPSGRHVRLTSQARARAEELCKLRLEAGLTFEQLARCTGYHSASLRAWSIGRKRLKPYTLTTIRYALKNINGSTP